MISEQEQLAIIYQDEHLVAINKPSGLLVHRSPIDRHETRFALQLLRDQIGQRVYPVHRLDKPTSGVLLFGLSSQIARQLSEQFQQRSVEKKYLAVTRGYCPEAGCIDYPLLQKLDKLETKRRDIVRPAQDARTDFRRLGTVEIPIEVDRYPQSRYSLVELRPHTGRRHQLRRHMKHIGHPIIGDAKHGKGVHNRFFKSHFGCGRLLLACTAMVVQHPISEHTLSLQAPLDDEFRQLLQDCEWLELIAS